MTTRKLTFGVLAALVFVGGCRSTTANRVSYATQPAVVAAVPAPVAVAAPAPCATPVAPCPNAGAVPPPPPGFVR